MLPPHKLEATIPVIQQRVVTDTALVLDAALWNGAGTSNTIKGILQAPGIAGGATLDLTDPDTIIDGLTTARQNPSREDRRHHPFGRKDLPVRRITPTVRLLPHPGPAEYRVVVVEARTKGTL